MELAGGPLHRLERHHVTDRCPDFTSSAERSRVDAHVECSVVKPVTRGHCPGASDAVMLAMAVVGVMLLQPVLIYVAAVISYDNWRKHLRAPLRVSIA